MGHAHTDADQAELANGAERINVKTRVDAATFERLLERAQANDRSLAGELRYLLRVALEREES